jgi:uncharacterized protein
MSDRIANPAPLGFLSVAAFAFMISLYYAGWFGADQLDTMTFSAAMWVGSVPLGIVAILEFLRGQARNALFFGGFAAYISGYHMAEGVMSADGFIGWYLLLFTIYFAALWFSAIKEAKAVMLLFLALAATYLLHAAGRFTGLDVVTLLAGYTGLVTGALAVYVAAGQVMGGKLPATS